MSESVVDPLDIFGRRAAEDAEGANKKNINNAMRELREGFGDSLATQEDALSIFRAGFDRVLGDIDQLGDASRQEARDSFTRASGGYRQTALGRSLSSSTVAENFQRGAERDLVADLAGINEGLAGLRSNIRLAGLDRETGLLDSIARNQRAFGQSQADLRMGVQYQAPPSVFSQLMGGGGGAGIAGLFL